MGKLFILAFMLSAASTQAARPCKVYGITDGPQRLKCSFPDREILLSCQDGKYHLNNVPVTVAFHLEVESGPVPLVYKAPELTLTVLLNDPIEADYVSGEARARGNCKRL